MLDIPYPYQDVRFVHAVKNGKVYVYAVLCEGQEHCFMPIVRGRLPEESFKIKKKRMVGMSDPFDVLNKNASYKFDLDGFDLAYLWDPREDVRYNYTFSPFRIAGFYLNNTSFEAAGGDRYRNYLAAEKMKDVFFDREVLRMAKNIQVTLNKRVKKNEFEVNYEF